MLHLIYGKAASATIMSESSLIACILVKCVFMTIKQAVLGEDVSATALFEINKGISKQRRHSLFLLTKLH